LSGLSKIRVAVLMGGRSSEHDISVVSARSVVAALDPELYDVREIEISREGRWSLPAAPQPELGLPPGSCLPVAADNYPEPFGEIDVVFPVLHGPFGEDGTIQGLLELAGVAYVGSGVTASAVCMDKDIFKSVMRDKGIPVPASLTARRHYPSEVENPFGLPVVIKPARLGSSVGITVARTPQELERGVELAFEHDEKILLEEYVRGVEVECSVLGNEEPIASLPGEIVALKADWYDFASKYDEGGMELIVPPRIPEETVARVQELSVASFLASDCEGMARVDCFVREDGEVLVNELNTIPGFTSTSVYSKLFEASGIPYVELLDRLIQLALERRDRRASLRF
jgi:D-alanine-D-alanine ligase